MKTTTIIFNGLTFEGSNYLVTGKFQVSITRKKELVHKSELLIETYNSVKKLELTQDFNDNQVLILHLNEMSHLKQDELVIKLRPEEEKISIVEIFSIGI